MRILHFKYFPYIVKKMPKICYIVYWPVFFVLFNTLIFLFHFLIDLFRPLKVDESPFNAKNFIKRSEETDEEESESREVAKRAEDIEE